MCNGARNMKMATWDSLESRWVIKQCSVSNICSVKIDKARGELELVSQTWVKPNLRLKTFSKWRVCISRLNRYLWNWLFKSGGGRQEGWKEPFVLQCWSRAAVSGVLRQLREALCSILFSKHWADWALSPHSVFLETNSGKCCRFGRFSREIWDP